MNKMKKCLLGQNQVIGIQSKCWFKIIWMDTSDLMENIDETNEHTRTAITKNILIKMKCCVLSSWKELIALDFLFELGSQFIWFFNDFESRAKMYSKGPFFGHFRFVKLYHFLFLISAISFNLIYHHKVLIFNSFHFVPFFYIDIPLTHDTVNSELAPNFTCLEILLIETFSNQLVTDFRVPIW